VFIQQIPNVNNPNIRMELVGHELVRQVHIQLPRLITKKQCLKTAQTDPIQTRSSTKKFKLPRNDHKSSK